MSTDAWNPAQYERFRTQRAQPFHDLVALIRPEPVRRCLDLGCGTGEHAASMAERWTRSEWLGVDASAAMFREAQVRASERVRFELGDIRDARDYGAYDLVFSNAALQWLPDHEPWLEATLRAMKPGSQIAVQMPRNFNGPSHTVATAIAESPAFRDRFRAQVRPPATLTLERYAEVLYASGFRTQVCFEKVYGHELAHSTDVVEWVKGTLLNAYLPLLDAADREAFVAAYRSALLREIGEHAPYFFPFRRLLFWAQRD